VLTGQIPLVGRNAEEERGELRGENFFSFTSLTLPTCLCLLRFDVVAPFVYTGGICTDAPGGKNTEAFVELFWE
jgi:hypothetical protein